MVRARLLRLAERRARLTERAHLERESLAALVARTDGASDLAASALNTSCVAWFAPGGRRRA